MPDDYPLSGFCAYMIVSQVEGSTASKVRSNFSGYKKDRTCYHLM